jgi:hypothetical protein
MPVSSLIVGRIVDLDAKMGQAGEVRAFVLDCALR